MIKTEYIRIRLSERDKGLIRDAAEKKQMTMSEYIIDLIRADTRRTDDSDKNT